MTHSSNTGLRIVFAGTPDFAAFHLQALIDSEHSIVAVYTQPDRPAGRGKKLTPSAVKKLAQNHDLPVYQPASLKSEDAQDELAAHNADIMIVVAYGLLLPKAVLTIPKYGCLNVHGSLLPRWRGAAPIQRAVEAGDTSSGVTIMQMDVGLDTGDMLLKAECDITPNDTSASLHDKLMHLGAPALLETLNLLRQGELAPEKQDDSLANYAEKIQKEEALIDWSQSATTIDRAIRAFNPFPVAFTLLKGERLKCYEAILKDHNEDKEQQSIAGKIIDFSAKGLTVACGTGQITLTRCQLPGKKPMDAAALFNGYRETFQEGDYLGK